MCGRERRRVLLLRRPHCVSFVPLLEESVSRVDISPTVQLNMVTETSFESQFIFGQLEKASCDTGRSVACVVNFKKSFFSSQAP